MQKSISGKVTVNGIELYHEIYEQTPEADTIVMLHGFLSSVFSFRRLIPYLQQQYTIIAIDFPPFGKSGKSKRFLYSYRNIAETILQFLKTLPYQNYSVVGHSMGGQIALHMLRLEPDFFQKAILLSCSSYLKKLKPSLMLLSYLPIFPRIVKRYLEKTGVRGNLELVVHDKMIIDDNMVIGYEEPFRNPAIFKGLARFIRDREGDLTSAEIGSIRTPCLLIWGEFDRIVPMQTGRRLAEDLPNSRLVILPDTGHLVPEEKPMQVFQEIQLFQTQLMAEKE